MVSIVNKFIFDKILSWKISGNIPLENKMVFAVGPHTSNFDFFVGLFFRSKLRMENQIKFIGKAELFQIPLLGKLLRNLGGIPVVRSQKNNTVNYLVDLINNSDKIFLSLFPEGTRGKVKKLKTGFYYIALNSKVPIQLVGFDFKKKIVEFGEKIIPSGDIDSDMKQIVSYYSKLNGKNPEKGLK